MPLTQEQINSFTTKARAAGATDEQIMVSIARKKAQIDAIDRANQAAQAGILPADKALEAGADISVIQQAQQKTAQSQKQPLLDAVSGLLAENTKPITGNMQISEGLLSNLNPQNIIDALTGRKAQATKNKYDRVKAMLSLDEVDKLRGTGSITDREQALLAAAASDLGRNLSDTEFKKVLKDIQTSLNGGKPVENNTIIDTDDEALINKYKNKK